MSDKKKKKDGDKPKDKPLKAEAPTESPVAAAKDVDAGGGSAAAAPGPQDTTDTASLYKALYDELGKMYWQASDLQAKDTVQGIRDAIYKIITELDQAQLDANTDTYAELKQLVQKTNSSLRDLEDQVNNITKNIATAAKVIAAITKVLSIAARV